MGIDTTLQILDAYKKHPVAGMIITYALVGLLILLYYIDKKQKDKKRD
jgi:hypothetical protein